MPISESIVPGVATSVVDLTPASIASGNTAVTIGADLDRKYAFIQNPSTATQQNIAAAESLFIRFTGTAAVNGATSIELLPGASWESPMDFAPTGQISVIATTINHRFIAWGFK